jgi:acyl-coenzyme A synthetase/AMP-(fatty) acid ligase
LPRVRTIEGAVFLHASSASRFVAGLLAGAAAGKEIALPAHTQAAYLAELGCAPGSLVADDAFESLAADADIDVSLRDPLLVLFTSGSTNAPKRVEKHLSRLETEARVLDSLWGREAGHVVATVSHQHIYGMLFRVFWPVLSGRTADDIPATYWEDLEGRLAGATLISSPAHLTRLPPREDLFAPPPALAFSSGQALPWDAAQACGRTFGAPAIEVLGSTETGGVAWRKQASADELWTPFPDISVSAGEERALIVRSPYLQQPEPMATGDAVEFAPDGRFRLLPRGDRVAKVDGKRVSLARVEEALGNLVEIDSIAALTLPERRDALGAIAVLTESGKARLGELGAFRLSRFLRAAASSALEPPERPKHWRFVEAIPTDAQGKRVLSTLRALFGAPDPLDMLDLDVRTHNETSAEIAFTLPRELVFFEGHFRDHAILPGVAQVHLAVLMAQKLWGFWPLDANLARLKFRRILTPGDSVVLRLKRDEKRGRLSFAYALGEIDASQGEIGGVKG